MSRWDIPPADISTIMRVSALLVRSSTAYNLMIEPQTGSDLLDIWQDNSPFHQFGLLS
jgi:hypothetical protein